MPPKKLEMELHWKKLCKKKPLTKVDKGWDKTLVA